MAAMGGLMEDDESRLRDLCSRAADMAADFPRGEPVDVDPEADVSIAMTAYWNVGLTRAAGLIARTIIEMCSRRATETILVRRALMELFANLAVLNRDPANAVRFSLEQQVSNERLFASMERHGVGSADELAEKGAQVDSVRSQLEAYGFDTDNFPTGYRPFGLSTKDRFQAAGIHDAYYDLLYSIASDYAHMNARAVERVLDHDFGAKDARGELAITTDFLIRILTAANDKLGRDLGPDIDALKAGVRRGGRRSTRTPPTWVSVNPGTGCLRPN
jgi:Family of unknown function (DUF5677)